MANGFRRFLINFRELFTREEDLYQAEKIVKRLQRESAMRAEFFRKKLMKKDFLEELQKLMTQ